MSSLWLRDSSSLAAMTSLQSLSSASLLSLVFCSAFFSSEWRDVASVPSPGLPGRARLALEPGDFICPGESKVGGGVLEESSPRRQKSYLICLKPHKHLSSSRLKRSPELTISTYKGQLCLILCAMTSYCLSGFPPPQTCSLPPCFLLK